jgi:hypothetical protein
MRDLVLEPRPGPRDGRPAPRVLRAGGREQASEGGATGLPQEFVHRRGEGDFPALGEALQEFRHEGVEAPPPATTAAAPATSGP